jgi:threonine/homoserine/homoserine lactone efflux protein
LRHRSSFSFASSQDTRALWTIYRQSVIGNALNPKVTLFFLSFLPQFVNVDAGHVALQMALLGVVFMIQTAILFSLIAVFSGWIGERVRRNPAIGTRLNTFAGVTFIALGIRVALPDLNK